MSQGTLDCYLPERKSTPIIETLSQRRLLAIAHALLVVAGLIVLGSYALVAIAHISDRFQFNFVSSVYTALAVDLNAGRFYPEVYDGSHYGGTRYMPGHFVLHAILARLTGNYLFAGKLLTYTATIALFAQMFVILRYLQCRRSVAFALLGLIVTSAPGFLACTTVRGDLLPVVLQLAALLLAADGQKLGRATGAGLCCTLALLTYYSAVWAPAAIALWYLLRNRRCCLIFALSLLGSLAAAFGLLHLATSGHLLANLLAMASCETGAKAILLAPLLLLWRIGRAGVLMAVLLPLVLCESVLAYRQGRLTIFHYAGAACVPVLLVIYSDMGADTNHLLDLVVLAIPLIGSFLAAVYRAGSQHIGYRLGSALAVGWLLYVAWADTMIFPVLDVLRSVDRGYGVKPCASLVDDDESVLAEDPWICLARGQRPTILDPFALARLGTTQPRAVQDLIQRIQRQEFAHVVLLQRLDDHNPHDRYDWEVRHFGPPVVAALRQQYELAEQADGYFVYRRRLLALAQR